MNQEELKTMVAQILREMTPGTEPAVKASDYRPTETMEAGACLEDISTIDLRKQYLVENPAQPETYRRLKEKTPARLGSGRAGPRYKTITQLRFRADHAAAQDSVFTEIPPEFARDNGLVAVQTACESRDQYLTRPDLGRCFDEENSQIIRQKLPQGSSIQLVIGDGLSSAAILANAMDCAKAIAQGLKASGMELGPIAYVKNARVGAGDFIGDLTGCQVVCMLVGERPGLVSAESMSAYITYKPHTGIPESKRTVVSNIHRQGTPAVEAGAHIAELLLKILKARASGVDLLGGEAG
ncbi:MAG: ethanolamine ammonia-lyase subunit EutC [Faecousia sp.]